MLPLVDWLWMALWTERATLAVLERGEREGAGEHGSERTGVRERARAGGNAAIGRIGNGQSRRRMTPINFP